jgi:calcineurin-like phosphoesterase family protein
VRNIWFSSDLHLFHENILTFRDNNGDLVRGYLWKNATEMSEDILERHNARVKPHDIWYCLGDLTFSYGEEFNSLFAKFHGTKRLIPGNHDNIKKLVPLFSKVQIWRIFNEPGMVPFTLTHVPIDILSIKGQFNVHGHIHQNNPSTPMHINISMEKTDFSPVHFDELQEIMRELLHESDS